VVKSHLDDQLFKQTSLASAKYVNPDQEYLQRLKEMGQRGRIELIMGPMFAGKSTELIRRVKRIEISGKKCLMIKYSADQRYSSDSVCTHDQHKRVAFSCKTLSEVKDNWKDYDVLGIDEGQFFEDIVDFSENAANEGKIVIISSLNGTY